MAQTVKKLHAMEETGVQSLGQEDALEKRMAMHSSILAWKIPWKRSLAGYSPWGHKETFYCTSESPESQGFFAFE